MYKYENDREFLIPANMQKEIICHIHNKGHYLVVKIEVILKGNYYIPQSRKQVQSIISNCIECIPYNKKARERKKAIKSNFQIKYIS